MPTSGRNEPCPRGSGQKHKKCCGRPQPPSQSMLRRNAVGRVMDWFEEKHGLALREVVQSIFLEGLSIEQHQALFELPDDLGHMVITNAHDWLMAEVEIVVGGERRKVARVSGSGICSTPRPSRCGWWKFQPRKAERGSSGWRATP